MLELVETNTTMVGVVEGTGDVESEPVSEIDTLAVDDADSDGEVCSVVYILGLRVLVYDFVDVRVRV